MILLYFLSCADSFHYEGLGAYVDPLVASESCAFGDADGALEGELDGGGCDPAILAVARFPPPDSDFSAALDQICDGAADQEDCRADATYAWRTCFITAYAGAHALAWVESDCSSPQPDRR